MSQKLHKTYDEFLKSGGEGFWQKKWEKQTLNQAEDFAKKEKKYVLVEFPYPSGAGLHVGHVRSYTALDIMSRMLRLQGYNVLYPMGWDAFGLPTENYAIKHKIKPQLATKENVATFKKQMQSLGLSFDWSREADTTDPQYYKWTQWIFLQLYNKGLAYKKKMPINWCPSCKIGLAHEEVVDGKCERCGAAVEQREKEQWMLAITKYADRLISDLDTVDYLEKIKTQQVNWIGKSKGAEISFPIVIASEAKQSRENTRSPRRSAPRDDIKVFTTRPDTLFGATYMVLAPEHPLIKNLEFRIKNYDAVQKYIRQTAKKSELQRASLEKEKTGVELKGIKAINPANNEEIPVWIADYVLASYGTGAIMAVPAHDVRDWEFAKKFKLKMVEVILGGNIKQNAYVDSGTMVNSGEFDGISSEEAKKKITEKVGGKMAAQYKLRDWVFSRQHYWGEPIPIIYCRKCWEISNNKLQISKKFQISNSKLTIGVEYVVIDGQEHIVVPVPEKDLPVELPEVKHYEPTDTGESPLATMKDWVNVKCPQCGGPAKRETDTMPNWAGSSWYFLRYCDPDNDKAFADEKKLKYWLPVDLYNGGMEHTTLHLLYSRFWNKFLYDCGLVPVSEPYARRVSHGMVLAEDGKKMSKSLGNVINPDEVVNNVGADSLRLYEMFMGPFADTIPWSTEGVKGVRRFLEKVWALQNNLTPSPSPSKREGSRALLHKTIKKVTDDIVAMKFNTAVSAMMIFVNEVQEKGITQSDFEKFLIILAPFAPHLAEELWAKLGHKESIFKEKWPQYDPNLIKDETVQLAIQVNGKVRDTIEVAADLSDDEVKEKALASGKVQKWTEGKEIVKVIVVKNRLVNVVVN